MAWISLLVAAALEIVWAFTLKQSAGFTRFWASVITVAAMLASFYCLSNAMRTLPLGTAYAMWTGIGTIGTFALGIAVLNEPATAPRLIAAALILSGLALMKLSGTE